MCVCVYVCVLFTQLCVYELRGTRIYIINISHFILERGTQFVVSLRDRWKAFTQTGDFFLSLIFFREPGCANACTPLSETPLIGCLSLTRLSILWTLPKSDRVVLIPRGLCPVTHLPIRSVVKSRNVFKSSFNTWIYCTSSAIFVATFMAYQLFKKKKII